MGKGRNPTIIKGEKDIARCGCDRSGEGFFASNECDIGASYKLVENDVAFLPKNICTAR